MTAAGGLGAEPLPPRCEAVDASGKRCARDLGHHPIAGEPIHYARGTWWRGDYGEARVADDLPREVS